MSGFDQWLASSFGASSGGFMLPVWAAGALAAVLFFLGVLAFSRAAQPARAGMAWRVVLVMVGAGLAWTMFDRPGDDGQAALRRGLDARAAELTLRAIAPGSPLACLESVANTSVETACEKSLFSSPETISAAVAYMDARLSLLAEGLELAARDRSYEGSLERWRRGIEGDRFGFVAHVLATRGCTAEKCPALKLLRDPSRVIANLRERSFDANVVLHAAAWRPEHAANGAPPANAAVAAPAPTATTTTGTAVAGPAMGRYDFPSAASIPAISIMNAEPASPPTSDSNAAAAPAPAAAAPAKPPAPRRQTAREAPPPPPPQAAPSVPLPLAPPGTLANPR